MNPKRFLDARAKLLLLAQAGLWAVLLDRPLVLGLLALAALLALSLSGGGARRIGWSLAALGLGLWGLALMQALFYARVPRTEWIAWRPESGWGRAVFGADGLALYREGFVHGLTQGLRLVLAVSAGLAVAFSTDAGGLLNAFSYFRVPYGISFMTVTALRFVPLLSREASTAWTAAALRGFSFWRAGPRSAFRTALGLMRSVLASCVRRSSTLAASVVSRGFDPLHPPGLPEGTRFGLFSWLAALLSGAFTLSLCAAKGLYFAYLHEFYYRSALRPLYAFVRSWL